MRIHVVSHVASGMVNVDDDCSVEDLKVLFAAQTGVDVSSIAVTFNGAVLRDAQLLAAVGVREGATVRVAPIAQYVDPLSVEGQASIMDTIHRQNVDDNLRYAFEHTPEAFARTTMLYISCTVNRKPLKAFVDTGAESTIMSQSCAERAGLMHLLDTRYRGQAMGVGTARILGRVHAAQLQISESFYAISVTVIDSERLSFLLGLDMLKKLRACVDLARNVLRIEDEEVPFLPESEIPREEMFSDPSRAHDEPAERRPEAAPAPAPAAPPPVPAAPPPVPAEAVRQLVEMGFTERDAVAALQATGGNADLAASLMFDPSWVRR